VPELRSARRARRGFLREVRSGSGARRACRAVGTRVRGPRMQTPPATRRGNPAAGAIKRSFVALASLMAITVLIALVYQAMGGYTTQKTATPGSTIVVPAPPAINGVAGWQTNLAYTTCADYTRSMTSAQQSLLPNGCWRPSVGKRFRRIGRRRIRWALCYRGRGGLREVLQVCPNDRVIAAATMAYMNDPSLHPVHH